MNTLSCLLRFPSLSVQVSFYLGDTYKIDTPILSYNVTLENELQAELSQNWMREASPTHRSPTKIVRNVVICDRILKRDYFIKIEIGSHMHMQTSWVMSL